MPKLSQSLPKYRKHKASGQAVVTLSGHDHYLGPHGTKVSQLEYDRLVAEWLAGGRTPLGCNAHKITVVEVAARYLQHARKYYQKDGRFTQEVTNIRISLMRLNELYGRTLATEFGPRSLKTLREQLIAKDQSRGYINKRVSVTKVGGLMGAIFPKSLPLAGLAEVEGAEVADGVGAGFAPAHTAPFETIAHHRLARTLDRTAARSANRS